MNFLKKFGPHYAMERFGILFLSLAVGMIVLVGVIGSKELRYRFQASANRAIYTTAFSMNRSGIGGTVEGMYTDSAKTKALLLLHFDDMTYMPQDADDYGIVLFGSKSDQTYDKLMSNPVGMIYSFPSRGYLAIYLQDVGGFPDQIICMRLSASGGIGIEGSEYTLIYFDPGSVYATPVAFLDTTDWTVFDMVEECMSRNTELALRNSLKDELEGMARTLLAINTETEWLESMDVVVPELPVEVKDTVYGVASRVPEAVFRYSSDNGGTWVSAVTDGNYSLNEVTLYLDSVYTLEGGFDFNWQDGRILTGYLGQLTGSEKLTDWQRYMNVSSDKERMDEEFDAELAAMEWKFRDGTVINKNNPVSSVTRVAESILSLDAEMRNYYNLKYQYECVDLPAYLKLEYQANSSFNAYTVNAGENGPVVTVQ